MLPNPEELPLNERKRAFGVVYLRALATVAGFGVALPESDFDSIDLKLDSKQGKRRGLDFQVKCTAQLVEEGTDFGFDLSLKNYEDLRIQTLRPRLLLVVHVPEDVETWIWQNERRMQLRRCGYWQSLRNQPEKPNTATVTVRIPRSNLLTPANLTDLMMREWEAHP